MLSVQVVIAAAEIGRRPFRAGGRRGAGLADTVRRPENLTAATLAPMAL